ncbi:SagB/ThcOx family dehydrogenase [Thermovibrio sp.]
MESCFDYHAKTAHTYESVRRPHFLDWSNYPSPFKFYEGVKKFKLLPFKPSTGETLDALYGLCSFGAPDSLDFQEISNLAFSMNGITKVENFHGEPFGFRATPSAGALYPFELYFYLFGLKELPEGIYHYQSADHTLELLVEGDLREAVESALCCKLPGNFVAFITSIYSRSAWKYGARAYRYCLLDSGHMAGNGVAYLRSIGIEGVAVSLFKDDSVNGLLGLDGESEFTLCAIFPGKPPLYWGEEDSFRFNFPPFHPPLKRPVYEPEIVKAHLKGNLDDCEFYRNFPFLPFEPPQVNSLPLGEVILKRRSRREFTGSEMEFEDFKHLLEASLGCFPSDWGFPKLNFYLQVRKVKGFKDGIYKVEGGSLLLLAEGDFGREVSYLSLGQRFVALANFNAIFTLDFEKNPKCRDYRGALLEAGALGENLYLAAESLGHGACGIGAFYDFELQSFLGLRRTEFPVYIVSVGVLS